MRFAKAIVATVSILIAGFSHADKWNDIYAEMDSKYMTSNITLFNMYSPDAVFVTEHGFQTVEQEKEKFQQVIRAGVKVEVYQSKIMGSRVIKTALTGTPTAYIVFSQEYVKARVPVKDKPNESTFMEKTYLYQRVFDVTKQNWEVISEQSSELSGT